MACEYGSDDEDYVYVDVAEGAGDGECGAWDLLEWDVCDCKV